MYNEVVLFQKEDANTISASVSHNGTVIVIGDVDSDCGDFGRVTVYTKAYGKWEVEFTIERENGLDWFGKSVAISGDGSTFVVGACAHNAFTGTAYVYSKVNGEWTQTAQLLPDSPNIGDYIGITTCVSSNGDTIVLGGRKCTYLFENINGSWVQKDKMLPDSGTDYLWFGYSLVINDSGDTLAVVDRNDDLSSSSVQVYRRVRDVVSRHTITPSNDRDLIGYFGSFVVINNNGDTIVVGGLSSENTAGVVHVYVCKDGGWVQQAKLLPSDGVIGDYFGETAVVSGDGKRIAIAAAMCGEGGKGKVYLFTFNGNEWVETSIIQPNANGGPEQSFVDVLATDFSGDTIIVRSSGYEYEKVSVYST